MNKPTQSAVQMMKKYLLILVAIVLCTSVTAHAAPVNLESALLAAQSFVTQQARSNLNAAPSISIVPQLAHAEMSASIPGQPAYYIFNAGDHFIIVSGDDRVDPILGCGNGMISMGDLPCGLQLLLSMYKQGIDDLLAHPGQVYHNPAIHGDNSVLPLVKAHWDQEAPFYNMCPVFAGDRCLTGCACTSMCQVMHYWKYPAGVELPIPAYTTRSLNINVEELPPTTFDWDNMLDDYSGKYTTIQGDAVAQLMRYAGQAEKMDYSPGGSGTYSLQVSHALNVFGYSQDVKDMNSSLTSGGVPVYDDEIWTMVLLSELEAGRPVVYSGSSNGAGHSFNVDGYDAETGLYHINLGFSGKGDGYYALHNFKGYSGIEDMICGIQPPDTVPTIKPQVTIFKTTTDIGKPVTRLINIRGRLLTDDVRLSLHDDSGTFSISQSVIGQSLVTSGSGGNISITYNPTKLGVDYATITLSSNGAQDVLIRLEGSVPIETFPPVMLEPIEQNTSSLTAQWQDDTRSEYIKYYTLELYRHGFYRECFNEPFNTDSFDGENDIDCSSRLDEITVIPGWKGSNVFPGDGFIALGTTKAYGWLETPVVNAADCGNRVTVRFNANCADKASSTQLAISCGGDDTTVWVHPDAKEYCLLLPTPSNGLATVRFANLGRRRSVILDNVQVIAGELVIPVEASGPPLISLNTIGKSVLIDHDLEPGGEYAMRVRAFYVNDRFSPWTAFICVRLNCLQGDANHDNQVNIADINIVIDAILSSNVPLERLKACDINGDGSVTIADINTIINIILN